MKIGIIGSGNIGGTAARLFAKAGHEVAISNTRGPASLQAFTQEGIQAATIDQAIAFGDLLLVAIPLKAYTDLPADAFEGKIVVDAMNYYPQRDGQIDLHGLGSSGLLAQYLNGSKVVKAFNTIYFKSLADDGSVDLPLEERQVIYIAGDDAEAKKMLSGLIEEIGFAPLDRGNLHEGIGQEPGAPVYGKSYTLAQARKAIENL